MSAEFDAARRAKLAEVNARPQPRQALEAAHGRVWTTRELRLDFEVLAFLAPFAVVRRRCDGVLGSVLFQHRPRLFFSFEEDGPAATTSPCAWCHSTNPATAAACHRCGHDAHAPRSACACTRCAGSPPAPPGTVTAADLEAALAWLRGRAARNGDGNAPAPLPNDAHHSETDR